MKFFTNCNKNNLIGIRSNKNHLFDRLCDIEADICKVGKGLLWHVAVIVTHPKLVHTILLVSKPDNLKM